MPWAWTPVSVRVPLGGGDRGAEQRVDLLRRLAADRGGDGLGVAGGEGDLGAPAGLAVADPLGDLGGEVLGLERVVQDRLVDRLVDDLLEARHVDAGLARLEVDVALELGEEELRAGAAGASIRITFSTPMTPTRVRLTSVRGRPAWTSGLGSVRERDGRFMPMGKFAWYGAPRVAVPTIGLPVVVAWHTQHGLRERAQVLSDGALSPMAEELQATELPSGEQQSERLGAALLAVGRERGYLTVDQVADGARGGRS